MRGYEQGLLPAPMRGDFRAYGKVYRHLAPEQHAEQQQRTQEYRRGKKSQDQPFAARDRDRLRR